MTHTKTSQIMLQVVLALLPGILILSYLFGSSILTNIILAVLFALGLEAFCLKLRQKDILFALQDNSALVTAILLAVCLPPHIGVFKIFIGLVFAIIVAKHLYGGLGQNIFNPAMIGFVVLLIAFPQDFINWPLVHNLSFDTLSNVDAISQPTPLDPAFTSNHSISSDYLLGYHLINLGWLIGGLYLLFKKLIPLALPVGFILGIASTSFIFSLFDNSSYNPLQDLFLGGSMLGAFFIVTDPVTAATTPNGRWIYSFLAGCFCLLIRNYCGYPDGVAFAVIFMNTWVPLINKLTIKPAFGMRS